MSSSNLTIALTPQSGQPESGVGLCMLNSATGAYGRWRGCERKAKKQMHKRDSGLQPVGEEGEVGEALALREDEG